MNWKNLLVFLPVAILAVLQCPMFSDTALLPKFLVLQAFLSFAGLVFVWRLFRRKALVNEGVLRHRIVLVFACYTCYTLVTAFYALNPVDGYFEAMKTWSLFAFFLFLCIWQSDPEKFRTTFVRSIVSLSVLILTIGIYQFVVIYSTIGYSFENSYLLTGAFAHRNLFSQVILLTMPMLMYAIPKNSRWKKLLILQLALSSCFLIILFVRTVWVACSVSAVITLFVYHRNNSGKVREFLQLVFRRKINFRSVIITALMLSLLGFGLFRINAGRYISDQARSMVHLKYGSVGDRLRLWEKSFHLSMEKPLFGHGLSSWKIAILEEGVSELKSADGVTFYQRPHNDFIWVLSEQGIAGLIIYIFLFFLLFRFLFSLINHESAAENKAFYYALLFMLISYCCIACFSFPKERYTHSVFLLIIAAMIVVHHHRYFPLRLVGRPAIIGVVVTLLSGLVLITSATYRRALSEIAFNKVQKLKQERKWEQLLVQAKDIESDVFNMDYTSTPVSWYTGMAKLKTGDIEAARADFEAAYALNPYHIHILNNLGFSLYQQGEIPGAVSLYKKALNTDAHFKEANLNMAVIYFNNGQTDSAVYHMQQIDTASIDPRYRQYLATILHQCLDEFIVAEQDAHSRYTLIGIMDKEAWLMDIFRKSVMNEIPFEKQVYIDVEWAKKLDHKKGKNK